MNEILFFSHIILIFLFLAAAVRLGQGVLTVFIALTSVLANLFVVKQMTLFGFQVTCSDVFAVGGILGLNLLQDLYGKEAARRAIRSSIFAMILFTLMSQIHLFYSPTMFDQTQSAYVLILGQTPRIVLASLTVYYIVQRIDVIFFAFLKRWIESLGTRLLISLLVNQALDTVLFSFFGLYGLVASLFDIILVSYSVKCAIIASSSYLAALLKRYAWREAA
jgi:queuosine precursor transporter